MQHRIIYAFILLRCCAGFGIYRDRIPNGHNVPNPCKLNETWPGVGHKLLGGGLARNPFGVDFAGTGHVWNIGLCSRDSDGDGVSNGQELGDPGCIWLPGDADPNGTISHPGICEPWSDPKCLAGDQAWVLENCQPDEFQCEGLQQPETQNMTVKFPRTRVPRAKTIYHCQIFQVPNDTDYHIIATTPMINNTDIMHHAMLFGCNGDVEATSEPQWCGMTAGRECSAIISAWTLGMAGDCLHQKTGIRIGANGFRHVALQLHWNNPEERDDYFDESGLTIFFTPNLRDNDAGIMTVGQEAIILPPEKPEVTVEATCPSDCLMEKYNGSIFITQAINHMHYLGTAQYLEIYRGGEKIRNVAVDERYNYDNPQIHRFKEPIEIRPGDELRTRCVFSSIGKTRTTKFGWGTNDEMCFAFLSFYPKTNTGDDFCTSVATVPHCRLRLYSNYQGCEHQTFPNSEDRETAQAFNLVLANCPLFGECTWDCYNAVQRLRQNKCFQGDMWKFLIYKFFRSFKGIEFITRLRTCQCGPPIRPSELIDENTVNSDTTFMSECDWTGLFNQTGNSNSYFSELFFNVTSSCDAGGYCFQECIHAVTAAKQHRCFQAQELKRGKRVLSNAKRNKAHEFLIDIESCECELLDDTPSEEVTITQPNTGLQLRPRLDIVIFVVSSFMNNIIY